MILTTYDNTIFPEFYGYNFKDFFTIAQKYRYGIKFSFKSYDKLDGTYFALLSNGVIRLFPDDASKYAINFLTRAISFIDTWLHQFPENYVWIFNSN